jgi:hypothetical protein
MQISLFHLFLGLTYACLILGWISWNQIDIRQLYNWISTLDMCGLFVLALSLLWTNWRSTSSLSTVYLLTFSAVRGLHAVCFSFHSTSGSYRWLLEGLPQDIAILVIWPAIAMMVVTFDFARSPDGGRRAPTLWPTLMMALALANFALLAYFYYWYFSQLEMLRTR